MEWDGKCQSLAMRDMQEFLRAGFVQAKEFIARVDPYSIFAVPSFLETEPMMSHQAAMGIYVAEKRRPLRKLSPLKRGPFTTSFGR